MDVKTAFLNNNLDKCIYIIQPNDFIIKIQEHMVCKLHKSIFRLNKVSHSWNKPFDQTIKTFDFDQNEDEHFVYKKVHGSMVVFMILYVYYIQVIGDDVGLLPSIEI